MSDTALAVLWDVDGTLVNSEPLHRQSMLAALASFGIQGQPEDELLGVNRAGVYRHLCNRYATVPSYREYAAAVDAHYLGNVHVVEPMVAAVAACTKYAAQGRLQAAVSNSETEVVERTLAALDLRKLFGCVITYDGLGEPKPHPQPYLRALASLGVAADQAIAIEDSQVGCSSARSAGLFVVGLPENGVDIGANIQFSDMPALDPEEIIKIHGT